MSVPEFKERTILLDGFSKTYAMTGWRLRYGVMRPDLAVHISRLAINSNSCTASFTQVAGIEALGGDQSSVEKMSAELKRRRDVFVAGLDKIKGFSCRMPQAACYAFPNITKTGWPSRISMARSSAGIPKTCRWVLTAFTPYLKFRAAMLLPDAAYVPTSVRWAFLRTG